MMKEGGTQKAQMRIVRTFKADGEKLWKAWTDPEALKAWWGPKSYTTPISEIDLRVGGRSFSCMRSPDGKDFCSIGSYQEIVPFSKLVLTDAFADGEGNVVPASSYGMPGEWPLELLITVQFRSKGDDTEMELVHEGLPEGVALDMTRAGWNESFDKLDEYLATGSVSMPRTILIANPGVQEVVIRRTFDAPRELVFKAYTDPELIPRWWGPARYATVVEKLEARTGGTWRFVQSDDVGNVFTFCGVFHRIRPPDLIIQTFEFETMADHVELQTARFEEKDGRTLVEAKSVYQSVEDRDGELSQGMEAGMSEGFDRLDELLAEMKRA